MSDWLEATREVYNAGGELLPRHALQPCEAFTRARHLGFIEPAKLGGKPKPAKITQRGIDLIEGRITMRTPYVPAVNGGRAPGTHRRMVATWLMALPRTNEVRLGVM